MHRVALLLKRNTNLSVQDYQARWRTDHAGRMAQVPGLVRYVQSHPLPQGYTKGELLLDGIEELWFADEAAFNRALDSSEWKSAFDAAAEFLDSSRTVTLPIELNVIKDGAIPENAVKNIEFVTKRPGMGLMEFRRYWRDVHGPLASRIPSIRRYEQHHTALTEYRDGARPAYDGLAITWFQSTADMKAGAKTPEYAETRADEPAFLPDGHLPIIVTREHKIVG
jgi:uncharacterized protein (TIGR02118 family)